MCTVSWLHQDDGYQLLCNRDEKRERKEAAPPRVEKFGHITVVTPRDGDAGGSWIAVNEFGVSVCLLNGANLSGHPAARTPGAWRTSRGTLLMSLTDASSSREVCERVWQSDLTPVAPFTLVALEPGQPAAVVEWDGEERAVLLNGEPYMPLTSSSFDAPGAQVRRQTEFHRLTGSGRGLSAETLVAFHESHGEGHADAYTPCMHRADAATVSFSRITVQREAIDFFYTPGAPCESPRRGETTRIKRIR